MKNFKALALGMLLISGLMGCKKTPATPTPPPGGNQGGNDMPDNLVFVMLASNGRNLITSPTSLTMTYIDLQGRSQYITLNTPEQKPIGKIDSTRAEPYTYLFQSIEPAVISSLGMKTFYLTIGGKTDTLFYDVQRNRPNAVTNQFDVVEALFNGKPAELRVFQATGAPYYVLRRR